MSFLGRLRSTDAQPAGAMDAPRESSPAGSRRSHGLKDFLWLMPEQPEGRLLDLGPVAQATVQFFTDRGFRVSTEDFVRGWAEWQAESEAERRRSGSAEPPDPAQVAAGFLAESLCFEPETFHAILAWDVFDFLPEELLSPVASRLYDLLTPGGVLLTVFHDSEEVDPAHYRVRDTESVEVVPAGPPQKVCRVFQNREILSLFSAFRSSRTYVGRDHLREALFLK